eukprot:scaffold11411_cov20-Prasinocladus_malaysianus.AAC.1
MPAEHSSQFNEIIYIDRLHTDSVEWPPEPDCMKGMDSMSGMPMFPWLVRPRNRFNIPHGAIMATVDHHRESILKHPPHAPLTAAVSCRAILPSVANAGIEPPHPSPPPPLLSFSHLHLVNTSNPNGTAVSLYATNM